MAGGNMGDSLQAKLKGDIISLDVAADTHIYRGGSVMLSGGYAIPGADTAGCFFAGIAEEEVDNSGGANAAKQIRVRRRGIFRRKMNGGAVRTDVGQAVAIHTAQSGTVTELVDLVANTTNAVLQGVITKIDTDTNYVWVDIMPAAWEVLNLAAHVALADGGAHTAAGIGVADAGSLFTGENVEAVLAELAANINAFRGVTTKTTDATGENRVTVAEMRKGTILAAKESAQAIELATPAVGDAGLTVKIVRLVNASAVTITTQGAETIGGEVSHSDCDAIGDNITLLWTGTTWLLTSSMIAGT